MLPLGVLSKSCSWGGWLGDVSFVSWRTWRAPGALNPKGAVRLCYR